MPSFLCPVCDAVAGGGHALADTIVCLCADCGHYRISGTALALLKLGTLQRPDAKAFAELVKRKRGNSTEFPLITAGDLGG